MNCTDDGRSTMTTPTEPRFSETPALTGLDLGDHRRPGEHVVEQVTSVPEPAVADRLARVAWACLAEPTDPVAARLVREVGAVAALEALVSRTDKVLDRFRPRLEQLDLEDVLAATDACGARIIVRGDDEWPLALDDLEAPPHCLWVRGPAHLGAAGRRSVAIVGARAATAYGETVAADLGAGMAERDVVVVSGGAFGIDAAAHRGTLAVDGTTIAFLAGGVDRPYPAAHHRLLGHIIDTGAVVSELPPGAASLKSRFLLRNRLIATMTLGTVVVEAGRRSGSRNTAGTAAAHHRVVMAVPGAVTSIASVGCHDMIRSGMAQLVTDAAEVVEMIGVMGEDLAPELAAPARAGDGLDGADRRVFEVLPKRGSVDVDALAVAAGEAPSTVMAALGRLELLGYARRADGGWKAS